MVSKARLSRPGCALLVIKSTTLLTGNDVAEVALSKAEALTEVRNALANNVLKMAARRELAFAA